MNAWTRSITLSPARLAGGARWLLWVLLLPWPALAWNGAGHRLAACIAWDQLAEAQRGELAQLLREHPDYARWQRRADDYPGDGARAAFIEASTWPDEIRQDKRFYSAGLDAPTPTLPGFPDMERRRNWHGISYPIPASGAAQQKPGTPVSGRLDQALIGQARTLGSTDATRAERSYALPWLIHLVADAHQPLHTSVRLDAKGGIDARDQAVNNPYNRRKSLTSLHAYWDDLPGPPWLRGERLDAACRALADAWPRPAPSTPEQWLDESWQLARSSGYPPGDEIPPTIGAEFDAQARTIARQRVAQAGYRLAELLRELLGVPAGSKGQNRLTTEYTESTEKTR